MKPKIRSLDECQHTNPEHIGMCKTGAKSYYDTFCPHYQGEIYFNLDSVDEKQKEVSDMT